ncbi:MAG: CehA/McbA family metallohydrolase [Oscillospiraceae bacterium]|nr:CehA/McbA family metallohydrolase [Oscillospiraceae bacterium]
MKTSKISRLLSAMLAILMVVTMFPVTVFAAEDATAMIVKDVSELAVGDKVAIVASEYDFALSTNQKTNNRVAAAVTKSGDYVVLGSDIQILTIEAGVVEGTFAFGTGSGYLYAAGTSKSQNGSKNNNYLRTEEKITANSSWKITISNGVASVVAQGENGCNVMQYNYSSTLFSAYSSASQNKIAIYKLGDYSVEPEEPTEPEIVETNVADFIAAEEDSTVYVLTGKITDAADDSWQFTIEDKTGSVLVYGNKTDVEVKAGDTVKVTGKRGSYKGTAQMVNIEAIEIIEKAPEESKTVIEDGDYVIWAPAYNKALSAEYPNGSFYNAGVDVTETSGKLSGYGETEIWTVTNNDDGTISISFGGQKLGMQDSYSSMPLGSKNDQWVLEDAGSGLYYVKNTARGAYIEWYNSKDYWSGYNTISSGSEGMFALKFTPAEEEKEYTVPDGEYVIWAPAYNKALSAEYPNGSFYNAGVDVTETSGKLSGYGETEIWTVTNNDDGTISISFGGQKLGMQDSYSSMPLGSKNDQWVLEDAGSGLYYVKNTARGAYIEWYNSKDYWSGYNTISSGSEGMFALKFTPADEEPEVQYAEKLTELPGKGDIIVIYNSGNAMASYSNGKKIAAIPAELVEDKLPLAEKMANLVVDIEGNNYIFTLDGKYLTSALTGNGMSFEEELTDCGKWTFAEGPDGTWYIKNVGANYNGNYNQAMEYYSGFTTYGIKETAIYQMQLFLVESGSEVPDGEYVIWAPAYNKALSSNYSGYYNAGVDVTETNGKLSGYGKTEIWTVTNNDDGTISIAFDGKKLAMADSFSSMTLGEKNDKWVLEETDSGLYYVKNTARGAYIEWYASKNNWSGYNKIASGSEGMFALKFTPAEEVEEISALPKAGDEVVIYNLNAKGVLAEENDQQSIENTSAEIVDGKAVPENGAVVFTVSKNGEYFRFYNESYGYLCSNGTGNNAFYSKEASEDADWTLEKLGGGYRMLSRTAKYNGTGKQYLEYYADSYKTYSFYATNKDGSLADTTIYEFYFYPVAEGTKLSDGIVNMPKVDFGTVYDANVGSDYTFSFTVDAVFGIEGELAVTANDETLAANEDGTYTLPAEKVTGEKFTITVTGKDTKGVEISGSAEVTVKDEPSIGTITPSANSQTGAEKRPVISAEIINAGENAEVTMTVNGNEVDAVYENGKVTYTPAENMTDGRTSVVVTVKRADGKETSKSWNFIVGEAQYQLYFGQLHSHTTYSDGSGSLESALDYVASLPESANVDFVAFTDHSNYFDASGAANPEGALYDMSLATAASQKTWSEYKNAIADFNAAQSDVIAIGGFEMTWSGGPGHINTFNTPGIVSRNNSTLNNKTSDAGMKAYYALLSQPEGAESISQFNHPGSTFGTFTDFAYWDALIDTRIQIVEVGNGEGQIGAGGYYPSYEYYTMALDKGWHVAPTNNQDNHKGKWGNANEARDVIITDDFTENGIYDAIRAMRMYSTEDKNLEINYTVNGLMLGSSIIEVPETLDFNVTVYDPDRADSISKVELIVNSGKVAYTWDDPAELADGTLEATLSPDYSYYYVRVTEGDGDLAVTAPVWVGESLKLGISSVVSGTSTPVTGEELTITTTLFNSEKTDANVKSVIYEYKGGEVIHTDSVGHTVPASGTSAVEFNYTPSEAKLTVITVTAVVEQDGKDYVFTMDIELDVQDSEKLVYIGIDASHYNEYVAGNYKDSMGNFSQLASGYNVRTVQLNTSEDLIAACSNDKYVALILTAPSRRLAAAQSDPRTYSEAELEAIAAFNANGGTVIIAGWSDNYENYDVIQNNDAIKHMAETQNDILKALGSSIRMGDDATYDDVRSAADGVDKWRLYFNTYGNSFLTEGVEVDPENPYNRLYTEVFSHYGGATVFTKDGTLPETVTPVVFGHASTYSVDVDKDGLGGSNTPKYKYAEGDDRLMVMASEQLPGKGLIIVSGAAFMSNFEVQATIEDSGSEKNYSNYKICENLLEYLNPVVVADIADVHEQEGEGYKFTVEGIVTSNASGYDKDTAFFDCIYIQDETAGINCFPVAGNFKIGDKVRITGTTSSYQGERQLAVTSIDVIGEGEIEPTEITAAQLNNGSVLGKLVTVKGTVESFAFENGLVQTIMVKDAKGDLARVFIDGYITTQKDVENLKVGCEIEVTGLASYDNTFNAPEGPFPRIRIRNRKDVVCKVAYTDVEVVIPGADPDDKYSVRLEEKVEIPEDLPEEYKEKYSTPEKIEKELEKAIYEKNRKFNSKNSNVVFMTPTLKVNTDNGLEDVNPDNYPENGVSVSIPYPKNTARFGWDFEIVYLDDDGVIRTLDYRKTRDGLLVEIDGNYPIAVAYKKNIFSGGSSGSSSGSGNGITIITPEKGGSESNPNTGASAPFGSAIAAIIVVSAAALSFGKRK